MTTRVRSSVSKNVINFQALWLKQFKRHESKLDFNCSDIINLNCFSYFSNRRKRNKHDLPSSSEISKSHIELINEIRNGSKDRDIDIRSLHDLTLRDNIEITSEVLYLFNKPLVHLSNNQMPF